MTEQTNCVVFQTLGTLSGKLVGVATLNMEKALNALNMEMGTYNIIYQIIF